MADFLYGHWGVMEALWANRRPLEQLLIAESTEEKGRIGEIIALAQKQGVGVRRVPRRIIDDLAEGANHQNGRTCRDGPK
jgi:tRNA G18 (ribose-2'-O)-methylase SpoU